MATYTSKLNLKKPLGTEHVSRQDMNDNYDKIDEAVVLDTDGEISNSLLIGTRRSSTTIGSGSFAHGENITSSGENSYAAGYATRATGHSSHAEGNLSVASGSNSHAEGLGTTASGTNSHAECWLASASGNYSHAEGSSTTASGTSSHSEGVGTTAQRKSQHVSGEYNVVDATGTTDTRGTFAEIIGNGAGSSSRSNARALDWDGNEYLMGDLYVGCSADSTGGTKISDAFTGATSSAAGSVGLVPAPSAGDQTKFLCADGTWGSVAGASDMTGATASTPGVHGLVPAPAAGDQTKFLSGAGTWEPVGGASDMTGATASTAGVHGLVPAPAAGDQNKVLTGAGTWEEQEDARIGDLANLETTAKSSVVAAINELADNKFHIGDTYDVKTWTWYGGGGSGNAGAVYITLPKLIGDDVTSITYTKTGTGTQGLKQDGSWLSNPTVTGVTDFFDNHVSLRVTQSSIANNQTFTALLTDFTLTFA